MANNIDKNELFEKLKSDYIEARNNVGYHLLKLTLVVLEANKKLSKRSWSRWLKDPKVNLKHTQAKKLIAIGQKCKNNGQLTDLLNKDGVEKTYLICQMKNDAVRNDLAEQIIDADFTVKQTKEVIKKVETENKEAEIAIFEIKNTPKQAKKVAEKNTVSKEAFGKLKAEYESLLKEKQRLEKLVNDLQKAKICECNDKTCTDKSKSQNVVDLNSNKQPLEKPVKTDLENGIVNENRHSITYKGYELPLPERVKNINNTTTTTLIYEATTLAKNKFSLELS